MGNVECATQGSSSPGPFDSTRKSPPPVSFRGKKARDPPRSRRAPFRSLTRVGGVTGRGTMASFGGPERVAVECGPFLRDARRARYRRVDLGYPTRRDREQRCGLSTLHYP
ncbi:hypothetical protein SKAU_G00316870 [Synaphobranchus kaupii]|uniref:Uncharacterized protein n=1 Tax=Synaphobranchus kaupii TaxID=118154 RepID=A0A9Q1ESZ0_SYNKA|nr:hypothetical protein SKAU_G00316870 [Synaphobranchus kaupii]